MNKFLFKFMLAALVVQNGQGIQVTITYLEGKPDSITFYTNDETICDKRNAVFVDKRQTSLGEARVLCRCRDDESFYGGEGVKPICQKQTNGRLNGCKEAFSFRQTQRLHIKKVTLKNSKCGSALLVFVYLYLWNGNTYTKIDMNKNKIFTFQYFPNGTDSYFVVNWYDPKPSFDQFEGRLLKFDVRCLQLFSDTEQRCFLAKGYGTSKTMDIANDEPVSTAQIFTANTTSITPKTAVQTSKTTLTASNTNTTNTAISPERKPQATTAKTSSSDNSKTNQLVWILLALILIVAIVFIVISVIFCKYNKKCCCKELKRASFSNEAPTMQNFDLNQNQARVEDEYREFMVRQAVGQLNNQEDQFYQGDMRMATSATQRIEPYMVTRFEVLSTPIPKRNQHYHGLQQPGTVLSFYQSISRSNLPENLREGAPPVPAHGNKNIQPQQSLHSDALKDNHSLSVDTNQSKNMIDILPPVPVHRSKK